MAQCRESFDNGHRCRRNATQLNGRCGKCHGITAEWKHCTQPAKRSKHCGRKHKTLDEIEDHKAAAEAKRRRSRSRSTRTTTSNWSHYSPGPDSYSPQQSPRTSGSRNSSSGSDTRSGRGSAGRQSKKPLSEAVKRQAATACANVILGQNVLTAYESQISSYVSSQIINELAEHWDGKRCEDLAKMAAAYLELRGTLPRFYRSPSIGS
jgi:hypothetical protein